MNDAPTPRTDAEWESITVSAPWDAAAEQIAQFARQLERELQALAFDASRVEWKYGRTDDGKPKDWVEWNNLRESLGEYVRQPHEIESYDGTY